MNESQEQHRGGEETEHLADALWQGAQALSRAAAGSSGLTQGEVPSLIAGLVKMADELPRTMQVIGEQLIDEFDAGRIEHQGGRRGIAQGVLRAQDALAQAATQGENLEHSLARVQQRVSALYASHREAQTKGEQLQPQEQGESAEDSVAPGTQNTDFPSEISDLLDGSPPPSAGQRSVPNPPSAPRPRPPM